MVLNFADGEPFATGAAEYGFSPTLGSEAAERITLPVEIEGQQTTAIVDTGAPYLVCDPDLAKVVDFDHAGALDAREILIRGLWVKGAIHRVNLVLLADVGESLFLETPAFVPDSVQDFAPGFFPSSFLGLVGCLESIRFAVDPSSRTFYFGVRP